MRLTVVREILLVGLAILLVSGTTLAAAGPCSADRYEIHGFVADAVGRPLPRARVYILLDQISESKFIEQGFRAVSVQADDRGQFVAAIDCAASGKGDPHRPNPCAKKPKHVTVAAELAGHKFRLQVHRLKDLTRLESHGTCSVALPQIKLVPGL